MVGRYFVYCWFQVSRPHPMLEPRPATPTFNKSTISPLFELCEWSESTGYTSFTLLKLQVINNIHAMARYVRYSYCGAPPRRGEDTTVTKAKGLSIVNRLQQVSNYWYKYNQITLHLKWSYFSFSIFNHDPNPDWKRNPNLFNWKLLK